LDESMRPRHIRITTAEKQALRELHPLLLRIADDSSLRESFWAAMRQAPLEEINAVRARDIILKGMMRFVFESHDHGSYCTGRDGRRYHVKSGNLARLVQEVDPKGVFVSYGTE